MTDVHVNLSPAEMSLVLIALGDLLHHAGAEEAPVLGALIERLEEADRVAQQPQGSRAV